MHRNFSFPLLHCYSAMDVLQMQMQHCNNYQNNQDLSLPSGSDILPIIDPAERVRYMTCRLTSDISTKEFHLYCTHLYTCTVCFPPYDLHSRDQLCGLHCTNSGCFLSLIASLTGVCLSKLDRAKTCRKILLAPPKINTEVNYSS